MSSDGLKVGLSGLLTWEVVFAGYPTSLACDDVFLVFGFTVVHSQ